MASPRGHPADQLIFLRATEDYINPRNPRLGLAFRKDAMFVLLNDHSNSMCKDPPDRPKRKLLHFVYNRVGQYGFVPKSAVSVIKDSKLDWMTKDKFMRTVMESAGGVTRTPLVEKDWCVAIDYYRPPPSTANTELSLELGDKIRIKQRHDGWFFGVCKGREGWFPKNYVQESFVVDTNLQYTYQFTVDALRSFLSEDPRHLQFTVRDRLDVIQRPKSPDEFWVARNKEGRVGLIPKARVEERTDLPSVLFHWPWYHSPCTREAAARSLGPYKERANFYLLRDSESYPGCFTICITTGVNNRILNIVVQTISSGYRVNDMNFETLEELVSYHSSHTIFDSSPHSMDGYQIFLRVPVHRPNDV